METEKLVVTRYQSLVDYLIKLELIDKKTKVLSHARIEDVQGRHVLGVLPYWLACHTAKFTEIKLRVPQEKRGKKLSIEEIEFYSLKPKSYIITQVSFEEKEEKKEEKKEKKEK